MSKILYAIAASIIYSKDHKPGPLTVDKAKELVGWQEEKDGPKKGFGKDYLLKDVDGNKVRCLNNLTNRPFRRTLALRYANEMLRGKWKLNGEAIVIDRHGKVQSGQHRLIALILAEQMRIKAAQKWKEIGGWKGAITIPTFVNTGISEKKDTVDTLDLGQKRTLGDVVFRNHTFGKDVGDREAKKLSNMLAGSTRLAWLRSGGLAVSDAPHFPHSEALDFIEDHGGLQESVEMIHNENGGTGVEGSKISMFISLGYAAGLHYLMSVSGTDPEAFQDEGPAAINTDMKNQADEFWVLFAQGADLKKGSPILALRGLLPKIDASGAAGRDEIIGTVIKAFNLWVDGKKVKTVKDIKVKKTKDDDGKLVLAETPRLGGIDTEVEVIVDDETEAEADAQEAPVEDDTPKTPPSKGSKAGDEWAVDDTAWVKDRVDGQHWFGTIKDFFEVKDGKDDDEVVIPMVSLVAFEDGKDYEAELVDLVIGKPRKK